ncbi:unnamed protein product [Lymnaea stagnalis]|uniref:Ig-like domain-containing protein n=1 Tax=Lymnaea stagnalis TaxID=6523 RepID=A0AAV2H742_LYMST
MEYTSPGGAVLRWLTVLTSLAYIMNLSGPYAAGQQHDIRHSRHYNRQSANHRFHDFDYEDSTVVLQPEFLNTKANVTVREGELATLPCAVRNLGTKQVAWRRLGDKDNHFLTVGTFTWVRENNIYVDHKSEEGQVSRWNLIIKSVEKEDEATYQCQITDKVPLRTHVYLTVKRE